MIDVHEIFLSIRTGLARAVANIVPPHEIEDVVQESYVRLCQVKNKQDILHPRSYLFRTVRNLALDHVKRAEYRLNDSWEEESDGHLSTSGERDLDEVFETVASGEEFASFCESVRQLPVQCRRVFVLKKVYGYSQREIASELGISESTVEKHIALGIKRCTAYMENKSSVAAGSNAGKAGRSGRTAV